MNFDSPDIRDDAIRKRLKADHDRMMKKFGWYAHYVPNDPDSPTDFNAHTHGFEETWNHPDVQVVVPMEGPHVHGIFRSVVDALKRGSRFEPGKKYDEILQGYQVAFAWAPEGGRRLLRIILPDKQGGLFRGEIEEPYSIQWNGTEE